MCFNIVYIHLECLHHGGLGINENIYTEGKVLFLSSYSLEIDSHDTGNIIVQQFN